MRPQTFPRAAAVAALALVPVVALTTEAAFAQTTTTIAPVPASVLDVTVNVLGPLPPGVTGYRLDATCRGVAGVPANEPRLATAQFPKEGGKATITIYLLKGANCTFRVTVLGTGPRPLTGNVISVGGENRKVNFPTQIDGATIDPSTVIETDPIPLEASTAVIIGQNPATTTTVAPTTTLVAPTTTKLVTPATTAAVTPTTLLAVASPTTIAPTVPPTAAPTTVAVVNTPVKATTKKKPAAKKKTTRRR
jgi:hypothetical protein